MPIDRWMDEGEPAERPASSSKMGKLRRRLAQAALSVSGITPIAAFVGAAFAQSATDGPYGGYPYSSHRR